MSEGSGTPRRIETLIINDDAEAPSLLNPLTGQMLITNQVGKRIIELADGTRDVRGIAQQIVGEFREVGEPEAVKHANAFLLECSRKGVVTWIEKS